MEVGRFEATLAAESAEPEPLQANALRRGVPETTSWKRQKAEPLDEELGLLKE